MIRVVSLDRFESADLQALCKNIFQTFGVGCEYAGDLSAPEEAESQETPGAYSANTLLIEAEGVKTLPDDKLLYVTRRKLIQPAGPQGQPPTHGFAQHGGERAVISASDLGKLADLSEEFQKRLSKLAIHELGHLWDVHSCFDPKCAMQPPWSENFSANPEPQLCSFCREKSERKIQLSKT